MIECSRDTKETHKLNVAVAFPAERCWITNDERSRFDCDLEKGRKS